MSSRGNGIRCRRGDIIILSDGLVIVEDLVSGQLVLSIFRTGFFRTRRALLEMRQKSDSCHRGTDRHEILRKCLTNTVTRSFSWHRKVSVVDWILSSPTTSSRANARRAAATVSVQSSSFRIELFLGAPFIALAPSPPRPHRPSGRLRRPRHPESPNDRPTGDRAHKKASSRFKPRPSLFLSLFCARMHERS